MPKDEAANPPAQVNNTSTNYTTNKEVSPLLTPRFPFSPPAVHILSTGSVRPTQPCNAHMASLFGIHVKWLQQTYRLVPVISLSLFLFHLSSLIITED